MSCVINLSDLMMQIDIIKIRWSKIFYESVKFCFESYAQRLIVVNTNTSYLYVRLIKMIHFFFI